MNSSIKNLALKDTVIEAVRWTGSDSTLRLIKAWGADVRPTRDDLLLQADDMVEVITPGDWIVKTNTDKYWKYTQAEKKELYVEVED